MKSVLTTLSGEELAQLRHDLELIKEPFSLVEFDDDEVDEKKGRERRRKTSQAGNRFVFIVYFTHVNISIKCQCLGYAQLKHIRLSFRRRWLGVSKGINRGSEWAALINNSQQAGKGRDRHVPVSVCVSPSTGHCW